MVPRTTTPTFDNLPAELNDILTLHSSFLTTLSLHYAHNGTATPIDLRSLTPAISSVWGKRKVNTDDLRILLGVLSASPSPDLSNPFFLSDYGYGKVFLEINEVYVQGGMVSGPLNESALQTLFMQGLEQLWKTWTEAQRSRERPIAQPKRRGRPSKKFSQAQPSIEPFIDSTDPDTLSKFLSQLPHASITESPSLQKVAPLREKGRKRLRDLKDSIAEGQASRIKRTCSAAYPTPSPSAPSTPAPEPAPTSLFAVGKENQPAQCSVQYGPGEQKKITDNFTQVRKTSLLDRILAKQAKAAALPAKASPTEIARMSALARAEEILSILALLAAGKAGPGQRASLSMVALCQALRTSVRSPISREEAEKCVEVLAQEVCPGYVSLVRMGSMVSVVVNQAARPMDVRGRLGELGVLV
ncbi:hypothetical protein GQ43DRAFT_440243 [Delitschia confertaspora ATCC 74209]|uniref:DNA replication factor Cdt1 C-terminal domain-containing protein n=1 Tax=Delitschia confertaspora ATCC 74209 TaxID=1513339 RepID=A0A9P4JMI5_9PLEO|nr:hypothetical protein GQ43DRAFT_440243 [Delitschia confertaspora ATCC 74209]